MGNVRHSQQAREQIPFDFDLNAALAASTTFALGLIRGSYAITDFQLVVPGGFAADPALYWTIAIAIHGGATLIQWSTQTSADGAITAGVVASKTAALIGPNAGGQIDLVFTKNSTAANLPTQTGIRVVATLL